MKKFFKNKDAAAAAGAINPLPHDTSSPPPIVSSFEAPRQFQQYQRAAEERRYSQGRDLADPHLYPTTISGGTTSRHGPPPTLHATELRNGSSMPPYRAQAYPVYSADRPHFSGDDAQDDDDDDDDYTGEVMIAQGRYQETVLSEPKDKGKAKKKFFGFGAVAKEDKLGHERSSPDAVMQTRSRSHDGMPSSSLDYPAPASSNAGHSDRYREGGWLDKWNRRSQLAASAKLQDREAEDLVVSKIGWICAHANNEHDWMEILPLVDVVARSDAASREASRSLRKEFKHGAVDAQRRAARVWALLMLNTSDRFRLQVANKRFLEVVEDTIASSKTPLSVKETMLRVLGVLAFEYKDDSDLALITKAWNKVRPSDRPKNGEPLADDLFEFRLPQASRASLDLYTDHRSRPPSNGTSTHPSHRDPRYPGHDPHPHQQPYPETYSHPQQSPKRRRPLSRQLVGQQPPPLQQQQQPHPPPPAHAYHEQTTVLMSSPRAAVDAQVGSIDEAHTSVRWSHQPQHEAHFLPPSLRPAGGVLPGQQRQTGGGHDVVQNLEDFVASNPNGLDSQQHSLQGVFAPLPSSVIAYEEDVRKLHEECQIARSNANVLIDTVLHDGIASQTEELVDEFYSKVVRSQELLASQIPWASAQADRSRESLDRQRAIAASEGRPTPPMGETPAERLLGDLLESHGRLLEASNLVDETRRRIVEEEEERRVTERSKVEMRIDRSALAQDAATGHLYDINTAPGRGGYFGASLDVDTHPQASTSRSASPNAPPRQPAHAPDYGSSPTYSSSGATGDPGSGITSPQSQNARGPRPLPVPRSEPSSDSNSVRSGGLSVRSSAVVNGPTSNHPPQHQSLAAKIGKTDSHASSRLSLSHSIASVGSDTRSHSRNASISSQPASNNPYRSAMGPAAGSDTALRGAGATSPTHGRSLPQTPPILNIAAASAATTAAKAGSNGGHGAYPGANGHTDEREDEDDIKTPVVPSEKALGKRRAVSIHYSSPPLPDSNNALTPPPLPPQYPVQAMGGLKLQ
ncbi:hypothetical protein BCV70DRAFT_201672 [Testicularia cyperi]|uniref:VHS domain-containing protein n=1 Tax=Testicularia cyperi TaxID=1882483 RepID=A0A317XKP2_9BASI|nr:hypothetical protein BCV70DRAFT_201672 [Testicularia cyperi]